jgi:hypothetical protein
MLDACGHEVLDRSGTPSDADLDRMRQIAPHIILQGLVKNPDYGYQDFKNDVLANPALGPNYLNVMGTMYQHGVDGYRNTVRKEKMPLLKDDPAQFMPSYDSFYAGHDADAVKTIFDSMTRIAKSGELNKARDGYNVMPDAELDRLAALVTPEELADPTDTRAQVVRARKVVLDSFPAMLDGLTQVVSEMEGRALTAHSGGSVADRAAADLALSTAKAHLDLTSAMHDIVRTVQSGVLTHLGRSLRAAQDISSNLRLAVPEAREFFDSFPGRVNEKLELPADHEAVAEVNPYSPTMKSSYKDFLMAAGVEPPEYPRVPRPTRSYTVDSPAVKHPQTSEAKAPTKKMTGAELGSELKRLSAEIAKEEAAKTKAPGAQRVKKAPKEDKVPPGAKAFKDSIDKIAETQGREVAVARRAEYKRAMDSAFDRFWSNTPKDGIVKTNQKGYTLLPADILPTESLNALKDMVTETVKFAGAEFSDVYRMMRDTTGVNLDWNGPNGERVNHIEALAMAYEKAFPGKEVPKKVIDSLRSENRAESEKAYKEIMSQTGDAMPPKGQLFNPRVAELARQRLDPNEYVRPGDKLRRPDVDASMNYLGGFIFTSMKKQTGKTPTYGRWVHEMRAATGTDLTAVDLANTWQKMKEAAYVNSVKPKIDAKAKAMNDAAVRLTSEQFKQFKDAVSRIPDDDPNRADRWNHEYNKAKGSTSGKWATATEIVAGQRAVRFSFDASVQLTHLAAIVSDPRRFQQTMQNMVTATLSAVDNTIEDAALHSVRNPDDPMFEYYQTFGRQMFDPAAMGGSEIFSSHLLTRLAQESYNKTGITEAADMGFGKGGKYKFRRLRRNGSVVELDLEGIGGFGGIKKVVGQTPAERNIVRSKLTDLAPGNAAAKKALESGLVPRGLSYMKGGNVVKSGTKVSVDLHPGRALARGVAVSERHFTTLMVLTRKALFDAEFQRLADMGLDPHLDHQAYQAAMDNIGIFTGSSNLSKDSAEIVKNAGKILSAPRYRISQLQTLLRPLDAALSVGYDAARGAIPFDKRTRIEDYKPSNKMTRETSYHSDNTNKYYLARYMPHAARTQMFDYLAGAAGGTLLYAALGSLLGGEIQEDPRHKNSFQVRFKNYTYPLPNTGVFSWLRFLYTTMNPANPQGFHLAPPKGSSPRPGMIVKPGQTGYQYNSMPKYLDDGIGGATKQDRVDQFVGGAMAPIVSSGLSVAKGRDVIGQPKYFGRFVNKNHKYTGVLNPVDQWAQKGPLTLGAKGFIADMIKDNAPLSPTNMMEVMKDEKAETKEKIMALMSLGGIDAKPTKFQKDPNYVSY